MAKNAHIEEPAAAFVVEFFGGFERQAAQKENAHGDAEVLLGILASFSGRDQALDLVAGLGGNLHGCVRVWRQFTLGHVGSG